MLFVRDLHLVEIHAVGSDLAIAVELECISELIVRAGEKGSMRHVDGKASTIDRERIVKNRVGGRIAMILSDKMVPCSGTETLERNAGRFPCFCAVIEDSPEVASIIGLKGEIVDPATQYLLAFEFDGLRSTLGSVGYVQIKFVSQRGELVPDHRMQHVPISIREWDGGSD